MTLLVGTDIYREPPWPHFNARVHHFCHEGQLDFPRGEAAAEMIRGMISELIRRLGRAIRQSPGAPRAAA